MEVKNVTPAYLKFLPFSDRAAEEVEDADVSMESLCQSISEMEPDEFSSDVPTEHKRIALLAVARIAYAVSTANNGRIPDGTTGPISEQLDELTRGTQIPSSEPTTQEFLLSYPLARIIISLIDSETLTDAYHRGEAKLSAQALRNGTPPDTSDDFFSSGGNDFNKDVSRDLPHLGDIEEIFDVSITEAPVPELLRESLIEEDWSELPESEKRTIARQVFNDSGVSGLLAETDSIYRRLGRQGSVVEPSPAYFRISATDFASLVGESEEISLSDYPVTDGNVIIPYADLLDCIEQAVYADTRTRLPGVSPEIGNMVDWLVARTVRQLPQELTETVDIRSIPLLDASTAPRVYAVGNEYTKKYPKLGGDTVEIPIESIRDHYREAEQVYRQLGTIGDSLVTSWLGAEEHAGWYITGQITDRSENELAWDNGFDRWSTPSVLPDNFDPDAAGRSVYTTNTYARRDSFERRYYTYEEASGGESERVWLDNRIDEIEEKKRLPDYDQLAAYSLIVDIDLDGEYKTRPLPDQYREVIEGRLKAWVGVFARILHGECGVPYESSSSPPIEDVFVIDSGGGAYVMTPPAATLPISEEFDGEELGIISNEIQKRVRRLTNCLDEVITQLDNAPEEMFSADAVQNKNRQWKTLLSLHSDLDSVVKPLDPTNIEYQHLPFNAVEERHYQAAEQWADRYTSDEYTHHVSGIVHSLFQSDFWDHFDTEVQTFEGEDWVSVLEAFVNHREKQAERREQAFEDFELPDDTSAPGVTTNRYEIDAALASVDLEQYLKGLGLVDEWDTDNRSDGTVSFNPEWRVSASGTGAFYSPNGSSGGGPTVTDRGEGWTTGIVGIVAYAEGITNHPSNTPSGSDWWEAVSALREMGEPIPVHLPDIDESDTQDRIGLSRLVEAAKALGVADEDDIVKKDGKYGEYFDFKSAEVYNHTLDKLEEEGINHGRSKRG